MVRRWMDRFPFNLRWFPAKGWCVYPSWLLWARLADRSLWFLVPKTILGISCGLVYAGPADEAMDFHNDAKWRVGSSTFHLGPIEVQHAWDPPRPLVNAPWYARST